MRAARLMHVGNPVLEWCIGNVVGEYDAGGNVYSHKGQLVRKIDAAITMIMGIGQALASQPVRSRDDDPNEKMVLI